MAHIYKRPLGHCLECHHPVYPSDGGPCHCGKSFHFHCIKAVSNQNTVLVCSKQCQEELYGFLQLKKKMSILMDENLALKMQLYEFKKEQIGLPDLKSYSSIVAKGSKFFSQQEHLNKVRNTNTPPRHTYTPPKHFQHFNPHTHSTRMIHSRHTTTHNTQLTHNTDTNHTHTPPTRHATPQNKRSQTNTYNSKMARFTSHSKVLSEEKRMYKFYISKLSKKFNVDWKEENAQRKEKKDNVVLLNLVDKEPTRVLDKVDRSNDENNYELDCIRKFISGLGGDPMKVTEVFRMGSPGPYRQNPRPVKVKCQDASTKNLLFSKIHKLKDLFNCAELRIRRDKTLLERQASKHLYLNLYKSFPKEREPFPKGN